MQVKLTTEDLPLIIIGIIGSIFLVLFFAKCFRNVAKKCERRNIKIINIPLMAIYDLTIFAIGVYTEIYTGISYTIKVLYIVISVVVVLIPTIYNIVKLGGSGVFVSFFQAICGITIGAIALASLMITFAVIAIGCIGGLGNSGNGGRKTLRSVDDGTVVYVSDWGDCWKDDYGNCYYTYSGGNRWYDDYGRDYVE